MKLIRIPHLDRRKGVSSLVGGDLRSKCPSSGILMKKVIKKLTGDKDFLFVAGDNFFLIDGSNFETINVG